MYEWALEGTGVSIERGCLEAELSAGLPPARNSSEDFTENSLRFSGLETEAFSGGQCTGNAGFLTGADVAGGQSEAFMAARRASCSELDLNVCLC